MAIETVKATTTERKQAGLPEVEVAFDFGDDLQSAIQICGEEAVFDHYVRAARIALQGILRRYIEAGKSDEEIAEAIAGWKPGTTLERQVDPVAMLVGKFGKMSAEEQAALLARLQERANG